MSRGRKSNLGKGAKVGFLVGAGLGAIFGAVVGAAHPGEVWEEVALEEFQ